MSEKEYIERGALRQKALPLKAFRNNHEDFLVIGLGYLLDAPVADVEPVVRARWQDGECTNCGCFGRERFDGSNEYTIRCPNCGAHMEMSGMKGEAIERVECERCTYGTEIDDNNFGGYGLGDDDGIFTGLYCNYHDKPVYFGDSCSSGKER